MTDEHDQEPEEPDGGQAPDPDHDTGEEDKPPRPEGDEKVTGKPARRRAASGRPLSINEVAGRAAARAIGNPLQRIFRESPAYQAMTGPYFQMASKALRPLYGTVSGTPAMRLDVTSQFTGLDLRHLMPGLVLSRNEAFRLAGSPLWETLQGFDPENWRDERLSRTAMLDLMEEGIPLVWTPSADVIRALLDAPDAVTRRAVLEQHSGTIVEHCCSVLADVERDDLKPEIGFLNDCLDSIDSGKYPAAQALASSVLDTVLRAMVRADASLQNGRGYFDYKVLTTQMPKATEDTVVGKFRAYCIHISIHTAYEPYYGPPVPEAYNRHATAHGAGPTQITLANALAAVMLAVGLLRELEETQRPITPAG